MQDVSEVAERWTELRREIDRVVLGQEEVKKLLLVCLLAGGHGLLEGVPGTGKTLLALVISRLLDCRFRRVQFTPDLMPADLLGTNVFNQKEQDFEFRPGPIFTDLLLADEINRTPPRTQAALLEIMQENAVTIDGTRRAVSPVFTVFATQNPVEYEGTYPLPEAQRDRFLLKIPIDYPSAEAEVAVLAAYAGGRRLHDQAVSELEPLMSPEELLSARRTAASGVRLDDEILGYVREVVAATRDHDWVALGAGPRAALALVEASRALALVEGRDFVTPDDVKTLAAPAMVHRLTLHPEAEMEGVTVDDLLRRIFEQVAVPR
ncbi:MAG: MoxR family ATPase [bacterium]|nr:MoxR family ATPase [bacterium]